MSKNNFNEKHLKAIRREKLRQRARFAPTGGTIGAQRKRLETVKFYAGGSKKVKPRIRVTIKK